MMDPVRRNILATGAAATAVAAAQRVFAQAGQGGAAMSFYEKGPVRIRYEEAGSGFPLLIIPGGGLNSTLAGEWGLSLHLESRTVSARLWLHAGDPGGFHLGVAPPDYVEHTIAELKAMAPDLVIPMHCTGRAFIAKMREQMPEQLVDWNTGSRFTFGL